MAAKYDLYPTPQPKDKQQETKYHARLVVGRTFTNQDIALEISKRCTIRKAESLAVLEEMAEILCETLKEGHAVKLDGIGTFRISAKSPTVVSKRAIRGESVKFGGVVFRAEKRLLKQLNGVKFRRVARSRNSVELSEIEIDGLLMEYFKDHECITTKEMQMLCGLSRHTALRRLKARVEAGTMTHPGPFRAPLYFPVPGNYGVSVNSALQNQGSSLQTSDNQEE